jgi:DNA-nicking Smr family endonuclease
MSKSKDPSGVRHSTPLSLSSQACSWNAEAAALDDEDVAFFRKMTAGVQPLQYEQRAAGPAAFTQDTLLAKLKIRRSENKISQSGSNTFSYAQRNHNLALMASDVIAIASHLPTDAKGAPYFCRAGSGPKILQKIRKLTKKVEATLDLHGFCAEKARDELEKFLSWRASQGMQCVKVIHGKGLGSVDQVPVLKSKVPTWLISTSTVYAFHEAPAQEGGAGAVLVVLRVRAMD